MRRKELNQTKSDLTFDFFSCQAHQSSDKSSLSYLYMDLFPSFKLRSATAVYLLVSLMLFFIEILQADFGNIWFFLCKFYVFFVFVMMVGSRVQNQLGTINFSGLIVLLFFVNYFCGIVYQNNANLSSPSSVYSLYVFSILEKNKKFQGNVQIFGTDSFRSLGNNYDTSDIWSSNQAIVRLSLDESVYSYSNYGCQSYGNRQFRNYFNGDRQTESKFKKRRQITGPSLMKEENEGPSYLTKIYKFIVFCFLIYAVAETSEWASFLLSVAAMASLNKIQRWSKISMRGVLLLVAGGIGAIFFVKIL